MSTRTWQAPDPVTPTGHRPARLHVIAALVVLLLGVLGSVLAAPAADASPGASSTAARHGRPDAPTLVGVGGNADIVTVVWDAPESDGGYEIRRYEVTLNGGKTWKKISDEEDDYGDLDGYRKNLKINKHYGVAVRAVNKKGHSKPSRTQTIVPVNAPSKPRSVTVTPVTGGVTIGWKAPKHDGGRPITSYSVSAFDDSSLQHGSCTLPRTARECTITTLVPGTSYHLQVWSSNYPEHPGSADPRVIGWGLGDWSNLTFVAP